MPRCGRTSSFHVRLEAAGVPEEGGLDSCGAHLAETVQKLAKQAREQRRDGARAVVYATADGPRPDGPGPFGRFALGAIPV
jgi:hypothetical protein